MKNTSNKGLKKIFRIAMKKNKVAFGFQLVVTAIISALNIISALLLKYIIDVAISGTIKNLNQMLIISGIYILSLLVISFICNGVKSTYIRTAMQNIKFQVMKDVLSSDINMMNSSNTSKYMSIFSNDIPSLETDYVENLLVFIQNVITAVLGVLMMAYLDVTLFVCVIVVSVVTFSISGLFSKGSAKIEKDTTDSNETFVTFVNELLSGFQVIKSFMVENMVLNIFLKQSDILEKNKHKKRSMLGRITVLGETSTNLIVFFVFALGAWRSINGDITAGTIVAFIQLLNFIVMPIQIIPQCVAKFKGSKVISQNLDNCCYIEDKKTSNQEFTAPDVGIEFKNVSFGYQEGEDTIHDFSFSFESKKKYAIVGSSGSGKTTILQLMQSYWKGYRGEICLGNIEQAMLTNQQLFSQISVLQQEVFIFDTSIWNNITLFKDFKKEDVERVIDAANLRKLVNEKGNDYKCGENGNKLSGGERQRIAIARSLLLNVPLLLMDEATSSLDAQTAYDIENTILGLEDRLCIIVTHRYNKDALAKYDKILVMKKGRLVECGTFDELIANKNEFWKLYSLEI